MVPSIRRTAQPGDAEAGKCAELHYSLTLASHSAKFMPAQARIPKPKGFQACGWRAAASGPGRKRAGFLQD
jgi:hypothetical protein